MKTRFSPKIFSVLQEGYSFCLFRQDILAGLIVAIISFPLAISFAISSGVRPEQGIITSIIAGGAIAFMGGSKFQVSGPTGAFVVLIYSVVQKYGYEGLALATLMAGVILLALGLLKWGKLIKFIPHPVVIGLTAGIAIIIFTGQIGDFLGLRLIKAPPPDFVGRLNAYYHALPTMNVYSLLVGCISLFVVAFWKRLTPKIPGSLVAIFVTTGLVVIFNLPVETLGSRFGTISSSLPAIGFPHFNFSKIFELFSSGLSIALLAGMESLLSCVVADGMTGTKHCSNTELVAQGIGNILSTLFSGIPATAGFARTAANIKNGGKTPFAAIFHAIFMLCIMLFFGKWMVYIPITALAAILFVIAYNMSEWRHIVKIFHSPKTDVVVLFTTFFVTIFVGLIVAIQVGVVLAVFLFAYHMVEVSHGQFLKEKEEGEDPWDIHLREVPKDVEVFEIQGPFFFAAVEKFKSSLFRIDYNPKILILRMRHVPFIDATGIRALEDVIDYAKRQNILLLFSGVQPRLFKILKRSEILNKLDEKHLFPNIDDALNFARSQLPKENIPEKEKPLKDLA